MILKYLPEYADLAKDAYRRPEESQQEWRARIARVGGRWFNGGATSGYVLHNKSANRVRVVFRGTELGDLSDIRTDLWAGPIDSGGCRVKLHAGTFYALGQVLGSIKEALRSYRDFRIPVDFVGHSLGGMLAQQCAQLLSLEGYTLGRLVTFGSPPAGNQAFSSAVCVAFRGQMMRVVRCGDAVPRFKTMYLLGYRHANGLVYIDRKERIWSTIDGAVGLMSVEQVLDRTLARLGNWRVWSNGLVAVSHHSMSEYARIVKENCQ